tara:strand:+ start:2747 stop:3808 length:1062 start_codon:yes stop_codon:yes gene_type:complete
MGKIFVKGPVESPDDLLAKQTMAQRLQDFKQGVGTASTMAGNFAATRNYAGAGRELGTSMGKFANNEIDNFGQFASALANPVIALLGRKPKTPEEEEYARQMIRIAQQDRIREQMRPARETQAYQELYERYGLTPEDIKQEYGGIDPVEALNQEKIVRQGMFRDKRRAELRGEEYGEQSQAKQTAGELEAAADAAELPPYDVDAAIAPRALNLDKEVIQQEAAKINAQLQPAISNEELTQMMEPKKPQLMSDVEAIAAHPTTTAVPADGAAAQIKEVETAAQAEQQEHGMDHKAGMEPPKQEDEGEGEGGSQMQLIPPNAFGFENQQGQPPPPPGSVSAGPDALNDLNRLFGR